MSFWLREMSDPDRNKLVGMGQEYTDNKGSLCAAPVRLQYWKSVRRHFLPPRLHAQIPGQDGQRN